MTEPRGLPARALATKQDLRELEARMDARFEAVNARFAEVTGTFKVEIADLERRMTMRLGAMMVTGIGVVSVIVRLA